MEAKEDHNDLVPLSINSKGHGTRLMSQAQCKKSLENIKQQDFQAKHFFHFDKFTCFIYLFTCMCLHVPKLISISNYSHGVMPISGFALISN